jgi:V8-like Glu-specific endopeptidase
MKIQFIWVWTQLLMMLVHSAEAKSIYGSDNRISVPANGSLLTGTRPSNIQPSNIQLSNIQLSNIQPRSVALVSTTDYVEETESNTGYSTYSRKTQQNNTQPDGRFYSGSIDQTRFHDEIRMGYCTAFLVSPILLLTAAHCFQSKESCGNAVFLFDYHQSPKNQWNENENRRCDHIVSQTKTSDLDYTRPGKTLDYALIQLDRPIFDRTPLRISHDPAQHQVGSPVSILGYSRGKTLKYADQAKIFKQDGVKFVTNLDAFDGNSGSPVFNTDTGDVIGIFSSGDNDDNSKTQYDSKGNIIGLITRDQTYPEKPTLGEYVTPISALLTLISLNI